MAYAEGLPNAKFLFGIKGKLPEALASKNWRKIPEEAWIPWIKVISICKNPNIEILQGLFVIFKSPLDIVDVGTPKGQSSKLAIVLQQPLCPTTSTCPIQAKELQLETIQGWVGVKVKGSFERQFF